MGARREILVTVAHSAGSGGVFRDEDGLWLSGMLAEPGGTLIETQRTTVEGTPGGWVAGGLLPAGAAAAVVTGATGERVEAACGGGAWVAVVRHSRYAGPAVRFEDAAGAIVRPPVPSSWRREPVGDADEPCPACGGTEWERLTPDDDSRGSGSRGDGPLEPTPVLACTRCGHEESEGVWYALDESTEVAEPYEPEPWPALGDVPFPVFGLDGEAVELAGFASGDEGMHSVTLSHAAVGVEVQTTHDRHIWEDTGEHARQALISVLGRDIDDWPDRSPSAITLWLSARRREHEGAAAAAEPFSVELPAGDGTARFEGVRAGVAWAMTGIVDGVRVTIAAADFPVERVRVARREP